MDDSVTSAVKNLRETHSEAIELIDRAIATVATAADTAFGTGLMVEDQFEYREAVRALRAARTAVQSADYSITLGVMEVEGESKAEDGAGSMQGLEPPRSDPGRAC